MKLQILVPRYDEPKDVIKPLLDSIALQQNVDLVNEVGVIVANDGAEPLDEDVTNAYPFKIEQITIPHSGVSAARDAAFDAAKADYVMFCDIDDMFFNMCGLYIVFREMNGPGFNALISCFIEESRDPNTKEPVYINHDMDVTFVHGKIYNRKYLLDRNIRWNHNLTIHEDSYFNCLARQMAGDIKYCQQPFYLWKWRNASVCRHDPKYILKTYNNMLDSNTALINEFMNRGRVEDARYYATSMIYDAYFTMNKDEWLNQDNQEYRNATEKRFQEYFENFHELFNECPNDIRNQIIVGMKNRFFGEGVLLETITFDDWIKHIKNL